MGSQHLLKIGKYFYFRVRIPKHLTHKLSKAELKKSLQTDSLKVAQKRAALLYEYLKTLFSQLEDNMLNEKQVNRLLDEFVNILLSRNEESLCRMALPEAEWAGNDAVNMQINFAAAVGTIKQYLAANNLLPANCFISWLKEEKNIEPEDEMEEIRLKRGFLKKCILALQVCSKRVSGIYDNGFDDVSLQNLAASPSIPVDDSLLKQTPSLIQVKEDATPMAKGTPIGQLLDDFYDEKSNAGEWRPSTKIERKGQIELFKEHFGEDKAIESFTRKEIQDFRDNVLQKLPKNRKKNIKTRNLSLAKQVSLNNVEKIQIKTINEYLQTLHMFMEWCIKQDFIQVNSVTSMYLKDSRKSNTKRQPYTKLELENIIQFLAKFPKQGVKGKKNKDVIWICLLGMFQGMRANEICQLQVDNIVKVNNIPCLKATVDDDGNQNIKNESSFRTIPIHQTLLDFGFLDFVNTRRNERDKINRARNSTVAEKAQQKQLFASMTYSHSSGKYTKNFNNSYTKLNKKITSHPKRTFHSLRHNFSTCLNHTSKMPFVVSYLDGHEFKTETDKTYTHEDMKILFEELSRLDYGIDIFSAFEKQPLSTEEIANQVELLPIDNSIYSYE